MSDEKQKVIVIIGATGSGKSDLAIRLAQAFSGEIICADSRTVYRGMDVGTAKPVPDGRTEELKNGEPEQQDGTQDGVVQLLSSVVSGVPHWLMDIRDPDQPYSVAEFKADAERCIRDIAARGKLPIVVGGTMLYIRALVDNLNLAGAQPNPQRREELERMPLDMLHKLLVKLDPDSTEQVDVKNPRRLIRAIETIEATGMTLATARAKQDPSFDFCIIGLDVPREDLHRRIAARTRAMFDHGLNEETQHLLAQYGTNIEPLRGVVYREVVALLAQNDDTVLHDRAKLCQPNNDGGAGGNRIVITEQRINAALRRYARRQLAWWRKDPRVRWVRSSAEASQHIAAFDSFRVDSPSALLRSF